MSFNLERLKESMMPLTTAPERQPSMRLELLHRKLDGEISVEASRRQPDAVRLARLKKFKLAVKDRLAWFAIRQPVRGTA